MVFCQEFQPQETTAAAAYRGYSGEDDHGIVEGFEATVAYHFRVYFLSPSRTLIAPWAAASKFPQ